jgi:hypothetical protein
MTLRRFVWVEFAQLQVSGVAIPRFGDALRRCGSWGRRIVEAGNVTVQPS